MALFFLNRYTMLTLTPPKPSNDDLQKIVPPSFPQKRCQKMAITISYNTLSACRIPKDIFKRFVSILPNLDNFLRWGFEKKTFKYIFL
jgi:hypothetical protein